MDPLLRLLRDMIGASHLHHALSPPELAELPMRPLHHVEGDRLGHNCPTQYSVAAAGIHDT
jgi:hypothetical protein